jgi:hypothetical protein
MAIHAVSNRFARRRALRAAKAVLAVLGIVMLSYLTVTSIEQSLVSGTAIVGVATAIATQGPPSGATGFAVPCATFPDVTCPSRHANPALDAEPNPPTF